MTLDKSTIFDDVREFPDAAASRMFRSLVGLDDIKTRLLKESEILVNPKTLEEWSQKHYQQRLPVLDHYSSRPPLFIFHGDVGTGKSKLAETFGDELSRQIDTPVSLYSLSLTARGTGAVGEMTSLLSTAFGEIRHTATKSQRGARPSGVAIMLIDEADALAQSRELAQMHHEDRAGVNTIIRGIDDIAEKHLPMLVVMCTNRLTAIDPAVQRRAAATFHFERPNEERRRQVITHAIGSANLQTATLNSLVLLTGPTEQRPYGFSYSDLTHRLLPSLVLDAYPKNPLTDTRAMEITSSMHPTPPFNGD